MPPPSNPPRSRRRRALLVGGLTGGLTAPALATTGTNVANAAAGPKVLRVMFNSAETSFDPARISDLYSRTVTSHIFESLYGYDHLARPAQVVAALADGMPACAGVALGIERLLMAMLGTDRIADVLPFDFARA